MAPVCISDRPIAFAHRGGAALWPENTLEAFQGALDLGFRHIESDVHMTRDGHIVCFHDATLDRTTNGTGLLRDLTLSELKRLDAGHRFSPDGQRFPFRGRGITVPTLAEALELSPKAMLNLEIKQRVPALDERLWQTLEHQDALDRVLIAAAFDPLVDRFRKRRSAVTLPTSPGARGVLRFWAGVKTGRHPRRYSFDALQVPARFGPLQVVEPKLIAAAHARGIQVHVWTVDTPEEMNRLFDLGVDGVMTDRPDLLAGVMRARGYWEEG